MEKLIFDSGVKEYQVNDSGVLRFNPSDPNVYSRFVESLGKIQAVENELVAKAESIKTENQPGNGWAVLQLIAEADKKIKQILNYVFGAGNNFEEILGGVNLMGVADNGERVIVNFLEAMQPIMIAGAENCAKQQAEAAVTEAKLNRAQRRAQ